MGIWSSLLGANSEGKPPEPSANVLSPSLLGDSVYEILVLRELVSIIFATNYIRLVFNLDAGEDGDNPFLDYFELPTIVVGGVFYEPEDLLWPDALRQLGGGEVLSLEDHAQVGLRLVLNSGEVTLAPGTRLRGLDPVVSLAAPGGIRKAWRPGESPSFANPARTRAARRRQPLLLQPLSRQPTGPIASPSQPRPDDTSPSAERA